ncbi:MAG: hypothetical protein ACTS80_01975 [Candidatus Hodgkinia cicadicola]
MQARGDISPPFACNLINNKFSKKPIGFNLNFIIKTNFTYPKVPFYISND